MKFDDLQIVFASFRLVNCVIGKWLVMMRCKIYQQIDPSTGVDRVVVEGGEKAEEDDTGGVGV